MRDKTDITVDCKKDAEPAAKWYQQEAAYEHHLHQNLGLHSPSNESAHKETRIKHIYPWLNT